MAMSITSITPLGEVGGNTLAQIKINPDATDAAETIAFASYCAEIIPLSPPNFVENMTSNCYTGQVFQNATTKSSVDVKLWKAGGTAADTAVLDFTFTAILKSVADSLSTL